MRIDFFLEEGVCQWHMTDEKRDTDRKVSLRRCRLFFEGYLINPFAINAFEHPGKRSRHIIV